MTIVIKSVKNNHYYITLEIEERYGKLCYIVQACPILNKDLHLCGCPTREITYTMDEKKKACATFNRYTKKYI